MLERTAVVLIGVTLAFAACAESTGPEGTDLAPEFMGKGNGNGGGGGGGGGGSLSVAFVSPVSLLDGQEGDFTADAQPVAGTDNKNSLQVHGESYTLTIDLSHELSMSADTACANPVFTEPPLDLDSGPRVFTGDLEVNVDKRFIRRNGPIAPAGIVANLTTSLSGSEYFLTTGSSQDSSQVTMSGDTYARANGFLRVNVDGQVGPICEMIVDYQFVVN